MAIPVVINGRFLSQRLTGVQRFALETLYALDTLLDESVQRNRFRFEVLAPPAAIMPSLRNISFRHVGRASGVLWEQTWLPPYASGRLLLSFSAVGPVLKRSQVVTMHDASVYAQPRSFTWQFRAWYRTL